MLKTNVQSYLNNQMRLQQVKAENDILLQRTNQLEMKINRLTQQGITPNQKDVNVLNSMVSKSLYLLAEVHTLQIVGSKLISQHALNTMINNRYWVLLDRFKQRLQYKRQQRMRRLHHFNCNI